MKKIILAAACSLLLCACGVGSYSVSSGKADVGMISFVSADKSELTVTVDEKSYDVNCVKAKAWRKDRSLKKTAQNTIYVAPGQHVVAVTKDGREVYRKTLFISVQEHKIVEL